MARTSFIDAVSWSNLLIPRPAPVPGDAEHRDSTIPRLCSWDLRSFRVCEAEPDGEPRDPLTEFLLVGATPGWRDVLPIAVDPPSKANRWEPIPTWEELALLNDTFDRLTTATFAMSRARSRFARLQASRSTLVRTFLRALASSFASIARGCKPSEQSTRDSPSAPGNGAAPRSVAKRRDLVGLPR